VVRSGWDSRNLFEHRAAHVGEQLLMRHAVGKDGIERLAGVEENQIAKPLHPLDVMAERFQGRFDRVPVFGRGDDDARLALPDSFIQESGNNGDERLGVPVELNRVVVSG
jgi:hypothetical protein